MNKRIQLAILAACTSLILACSTLSTPPTTTESPLLPSTTNTSLQPTRTRTPRPPSATKTPAPPTKTPWPENVLFYDNFSDPGSGWSQNNLDSGYMEYSQGGFRIFVSLPHYWLWDTLGGSLQNDVSIELDVTRIGGPNDNIYGVMCRYQDKDNYYVFLISSDGYAGIGKKINGSLVGASSDWLHLSDAVRQGATTNHLRADCIGNKLTLYVNDIQVSWATATGTFTGGDVALIAGAYATSGVDILFDNFYVYKP